MASIAPAIRPQLEPEKFFAGQPLGMLVFREVEAALRNFDDVQVLITKSQLAFPTFGLVTLHGMLAGSDSATPWMRLIYLFSSTIVLVLVTYRLVARSTVSPPAGGRVGVPGS